MEPLNKNESSTQNKKSDTPKINVAKSAGRPKMKDNNDDNEFATNAVKGHFAADAKKNEQELKEAPAAVGGSADKAEAGSSTPSVSMIEQAFNKRMEDFAALVEKAGTRIQRLGEALCRIGDQVEHLPSRKFGVKKSQSDSSQVTH